MTDNGIVWEDPRPQDPNRSHWVDKLAPLLERPGQWARVHEVAHSSAWVIANQLRKGEKPVPAGRWEFAARGNEDNPKRGYVYARYLGPEGGAE